MEIETLLDVWQAGGRMHVRCLFDGREGLKKKRECNWRDELDVRTLMWTRGRRQTIAVLGGMMRCPQCGCRRVAISLSFQG